jgi:hypothetical protein
MAEITVSGRMKVKNLKKDFQETFGASLRIYNGRRFVNDEATLASIRKDDATANTMEILFRVNSFWARQVGCKICI